MFIETTAMLGLVAGGCFLALVPAKYLLKMDGRSGYYIYRQELKASGDEKKAIAKAAIFYRTFGVCMIVVALAGYLSVICSAPSRP